MEAGFAFGAGGLGESPIDDGRQREVRLDGLPVGGNADRFGRHRPGIALPGPEEFLGVEDGDFAGPAVLIESAMDIIFGDAGLTGAGFGLTSVEVGIAFKPFEWERMEGGAPVDDFGRWTSRSRRTSAWPRSAWLVATDKIAWMGTLLRPRLAVC
ncbi:MAG: hypothetical protein ACK5PR_00595, partial [bacterium]